MLVLARYQGEKIVFRLPTGETMSVMVTAIEPTRNGGRVKLGIEAPRDIIVDRAEVYARRVESGA